MAAGGTDCADAAGSPHMDATWNGRAALVESGQSEARREEGMRCVAGREGVEKRNERDVGSPVRWITHKKVVYYLYPLVFTTGIL